MKLDILAFAAHPDDVELSCGGTMIKHMKAGYKTGVVDLTQGDLGTRGNPELRMKEAEAAKKILGLSARENLKFRDGFFTEDEEHKMKVIEVIRFFRPEIILANATSDRHPDHGRASSLVSVSAFLSGLKKVKTKFKGENQEAWRPKAIYFYVQDRYIKPDFIVDISDVWEEKMKAVMAFSSQFHNPDSNEPDTPISRPEFLNFLEARALDAGRTIGTKYGESFVAQRAPGINDIMNLL